MCGEMFISMSRCRACGGAGAPPWHRIAARAGSRLRWGSGARCPRCDAGGTTRPVSDERRAHRCSSAPSRLGSPPKGSDPRCSGLSERGYASERLRLTVRSARLAALASVPARRQPNLSRRDPRHRYGPRRSRTHRPATFGHGKPRPSIRGPRPVSGRPPPSCSGGAAPPQIPLRGRVSPVGGLSGPRQYRDEGPPPLGRQRGLHGF